MDNNNLPSQPAAPIAPVTPIINTPRASGSSSKIVLLFVIGLILIVALVGGIYLYLSRQTVKTDAPVVQEPVVQAQPTPPDTVDALDRDLNNLNVGSSADFSSVDSDLQQL